MRVNTELWRGKDAVRAIEHREAGNTAFTAGRTSQALLFYSVSALYSPVTLKEKHKWEGKLLLCWPTCQNLLVTTNL